jgi:hypothetical protein
MEWAISLVFLRPNVAIPGGLILMYRGLIVKQGVK